MAKNAMAICLQHTEDLNIDSEFDGSIEEFLPKLFEISVTREDSKLACARKGPMIVISASGMLTGGRVLHHLKYRLPHPENTVLFTGFQAEGTKGHYLQTQGKIAGNIRIHHEVVIVAAEIVTLDQLSSHADQVDLINYLDQMHRRPKQIFINHGLPTAQLTLASNIKKKFDIEAIPTSLQQNFNIF
ncbi:hypothetical protein MEO40_06935 [Dolichospermum sp. ST_sed1]|nr:hypothetical protein [Dolichospermum sp. ST_sed1]